MFLYLNANCCETKWLASFSSNVNTFTKIFTGPVVPHTKQIAHAMTKSPQISRFLYMKVPSEVHKGIFAIRRSKDDRCRLDK